MTPGRHAGAALFAAPGGASAAYRRAPVQLRLVAPGSERSGRHENAAITADEPTVQGGPVCGAQKRVAFLDTRLRRR